MLQDNKIFPKRLKMLREAFSVSQLELAEYLGVKQYYIAKWESGAYDPNPALKKQIANFFNISHLWLDGENLHAFIGVVFIPRHFILPQRKFNLASLRKMVNFICSDGAMPRVAILNSENKPDAMVIFQRNDDLLLFFPFISSYDAPSRHILEHEVDGILKECFEKKGDKGQYTLTHQTYVILSSFLDRINASSSIEEVTKVLNFTIPERLMEIWKSLSQQLKEVERPEWTFNVDITIRNDPGLTEDQAIESLIGIETIFNNQNLSGNQRISFHQITRKK